MKRRDLLKAGIVAAGAGVIAKGTIDLKNQGVKIVPKQTDVYKISAPMPFNYNLINELAEINSQLKKSKITTVYNNIPLPFAGYLAEYQSARGKNDSIKSFDDFAKYVEYAQNKGFKFIYVLNSPNPFFDKFFYEHEKEFFKFLSQLKEIKCDTLKVANHQLMKILSEKTDFNLAASTSFEFHNVSQFKNLLNTYPKITAIDVAIDDNKNFVYLKNLRKAFPDTEIEVMLNEACIHGCPARISHCASQFEHWDCVAVRKKMGGIEYNFKSNELYPWWLEYYSSIGINNFKFCTYENRANMTKLDFLKYYLSLIENGISDISAKDYFKPILGKSAEKVNPDIKLKDVIPYMPDIKHFIKYGDKCSNICDIECTYCLDCAKKFKKFLNI